MFLIDSPVKFNHTYNNSTPLRISTFGINYIFNVFDFIKQ